MQVLGQELSMAGFGFVMAGTSASPFNGNQFCPLGVNIYHGGSVVSAPLGAPVPSDGGILAPVRIIDGGAGPDDIVIARSDAEFSALVSTVRAGVDLSGPHVLKVDSNLGYETPGQLFLVGAENGSKVCTLFQLSAAPVKVGNEWDLRFDAGAAYPYNPANPDVAFNILATYYGAGDKIVNLGFSPAPPTSNLTAYRSFMYRRYGVKLCDDQPQLTMVDPSETAAPYSCANTETLVDQIVDLQAQYGIAPSGSLTVSQWVAPTGAWAANTLTAAQINQIKAVRIAVVSRSRQFIRNDASCTEDPVGSADIDLWDKLKAGDDAPSKFTFPVGGDGCQHYRYKIFTTVVPLKNPIWSRLCYDPDSAPCT
jgi:type IV pilus assembly protein PilW